MTADEAFATLRADTEGDTNVLGLVLGGSRGKGCATGRSDYDVYLIAEDDLPARERYGRERGGPVEVAVYSLQAFVEHAAVGTETEWNRYTFAHVTAEIDRLDGRIQELVDEKGRLPADAAERIAADALDAYVNSYYRSLKNLRNGLAVEAHLDAAESVPWFLTALFALHERVRPTTSTCVGSSSAIRWPRSGARRHSCPRSNGSSRRASSRSSESCSAGRNASPARAATGP